MYLKQYLVGFCSGVLYLMMCMIPVHANSEDSQTEVEHLTGNGTDTACLECHAKTSLKTETASQLEPIDADRQQTSVHAKLSCNECHLEITDNLLPHSKNTIAKPDCVACHQKLWKNKEPVGQASSDKSRLAVVMQNITSYKQSLHAVIGKQGVLARCDDCHDTHYFDVPSKDDVQYAQWRQTVPQVCGAKCHSQILEDYKTSVHGVEVLQHKNLEAAVCIDCHSSHDISVTSHDPFQLEVTKKCGSCHQENFDSYRNTYHGQINTLGYVYTAKCYDCHGSHNILKVDNPHSSVHPDNRLETCQQCHDGRHIVKATENFKSFGPHANTNNYDRYPQLWIAAKFMRGLLIVVFSYFWLHLLLWWFREYKDRFVKKTHMRIRSEKLISKNDKTHQIRRFGVFWRIAHLLFAVCVMLLVLTGMAVFYAYTDWAPVVINLLGGPDIAGLIHRGSAAVMLTIFFIHLIVLSVNIYRKRKTFLWFGPDSLLPNKKDVSDSWAMLKWFVYRGPRPVFDRWTYWEKFDYWAVFWGMVVIGGSGIMLALPQITAALFPGWVFNVIILIHGEEAFLAAVFIFTVHFFNNHFRPDKLPPPDVVMFTGTQSLESFKREHKLQYERLLATGELDLYLVEAPSAVMTTASKILGLFLIGCGLTLLLFVAIGYFGAYSVA